jgi:carbon-monoxide dehydrogenase large subunit
MHDMTDPAHRGATAYVGRSVRRVEDHRLLTGTGRFVEDVAPDGSAHLVVVRSPHPAARIVAIDTESARRMPGVLGVWTGADLAAEGLGGIPWEVRPPDAPRDLPLGDPAIAPPQPVLAHEVVRYVGEPVAVVVAETHALAEDAAEQLVIDYAALPMVVGAHEAVKPGAPQVWQRFPGNLCFSTAMGDRARADAAFARAAHVTRFATDIPRLVQNPMETRGYVGSFDPAAERYLLQAAAGKPATIGRAIANDVLHIPRERRRATRWRMPRWRSIATAASWPCGSPC